WEKFDDELQRESSIQAVKAGGTGDASRTHLLWRLRNTKAPDHLVSPIVVDGRMWFIKGEGLCSCLDLGKRDWLWKLQRIGNNNRHIAPPVAGDGKIFVPGENGKVVVLESGLKFKVLARNEMGEPIQNSPAIADGCLYIRTRTKLYCLADSQD